MRKILIITRSGTEFCSYACKHLPYFWDKGIRVEVLFTEVEESVAPANIALYDLWVSYVVDKGYSEEDILNKYEPLVRFADKEPKPRADICRYWGEFNLSNDVIEFCKGCIFLNIDIGNFFDPHEYERIILDIALSSMEKRSLMEGQWKLVSSMGLHSSLNPHVKTEFFTSSIVPDKMIATWSSIYQGEFVIEAPKVLVNIEEVIT